MANRHSKAPTVNKKNEIDFIQRANPCTVPYVGVIGKVKSSDDRTVRSIILRRERTKGSDAVPSVRDNGWEY